MKKFFLGFITLTALTLTSCMESDIYQGGGEGEQKEFNEFDFSTTHEIMLQVNYQNMGGIKARVYFEVYDQMPVEYNGYNYIKKEGILPVYSNTTGTNGAFNEKISLPAYVQTLYIYSPAFYAQTLIEANVVNGTAVANDGIVETKTRSAVTKAESYTTSAITRDNWKTYLGAFNPYNGRVTSWTDNGVLQPGYAYTGGNPSLTFTAEESASLYQIHNAIININTHCPTDYRSDEDLLVTKPAEVVVNFLGGNTCWASSMGYYYYEEGHKPTSLKEANVILLFPNTQDGYWDPSQWKTYKGNDAHIGVERGTSVQLKFFPKIKEKSQEGATTLFPANYRIGFALVTNVWGKKLRFDSFDSYTAATSKGLSIKNGVAMEEPRTAVYKYHDAVIFSFEDYTYDDNFSDVVFTMKTNPSDAIGDLPKPEPKPTTEMQKGVYCFEDLWPYKGDYDMNDAIVVSTYKKTYDASELDEGIYNEAYELKVFQNIANNINGLGVALKDRKNGKISLSVDGKPIEYTRFENEVLLLTDDFKPYLGKTLRIDIKHTTPVKGAEATIRPFIWKNGTNNKKWEVHIAQERPTHMIDESFFGTGDDVSNPKMGIYYVRQGEYPFAFFLAGATEKDVSELLEAQNESHPIGSIYSKYNGWVTSGGTDNTEWYKK